MCESSGLATRYIIIRNVDEPTMCSDQRVKRARDKWKQIREDEPGWSDEGWTINSTDHVKRARARWLHFTSRLPRSYYARSHTLHLYSVLRELVRRFVPTDQLYIYPPTLPLRYLPCTYVHVFSFDLPPLARQLEPPLSCFQP